MPDSCDRRRWLSPGVTTGIRRTLLVQVQRLEFLARNRLDELGSQRIAGSLIATAAQGWARRLEKLKANG